MSMRFKVSPGDVPPAVAARRMGLTLETFAEQLPDLARRGFPAADPTTGNYDLDAIDAWRRARNPQLFGKPSLTSPSQARHGGDVVLERVARIRDGG